MFQPRTWSSHVLNASAAAVLEFVMEKPRARREIEALLGELLDPSERPHLARLVESTVESLRIIDLIHEIRQGPADRPA